LRVEVALAQVGHAVADRAQVLLAQCGVVLPELERGHRIVEDEARTADQVAMAGVVDRAVVPEVMEEAAFRIDAARMVERHGAADVPAQRVGRAEIWRGWKFGHLAGLQRGVRSGPGFGNAGGTAAGAPYGRGWTRFMARVPCN